MKYAVVSFNGFQYKVQEKDKIETSRVAKKEGEIIDMAEVLLYTDGSKLKVGKPFLKEIKVKAKLIKNFLGEKLDVFKFRAKTGYRRKIGFRPQRTLLEIESINA